MDFSGLFRMQGMLFALMILGMVLRRTGVIKEEGKSLLSSLVVDVTLPASILKSFQIEFNMQILQSCMVVLVVGILIQAGSCLLGNVLYPGFREDHKTVLRYSTICSNAGVLGNPIAEGIFGSMGLLYASIYVIPQRIVMWSVGLSYFTTAPDKKTLVKKVLTHPCILAAILGLFIMIFQIPLPGFVNLTIQNIANANTFLAMAFVGTILAKVPVRKLPGKATWYYSFVRLFLIPFLVFLGCRLCHIDELVTGVCVVLSGMPAAGISAVMAAKYEKDEIFAAKCVVFSTLLSMITVPLWCMVLI